MKSQSVLRGLPVVPATIRLRREPDSVPTPAAEPSMADLFQRAREEGRAQGLEEGRADGFSSGHREGLQAGRTEAAREAAARTREAVSAATEALHAERMRLSAVLTSLVDGHAQLAAAAEDDLVALCFETVVRVTGATALAPETVRDAAQRATAALQRQPRILLRLHAQDAALLDACSPAPAAHGPAIAWRADDEVALGGCLVESPAGVLDLRLETLLADCRAALLRAREQRRAGVEPGAAA